MSIDSIRAVETGTTGSKKNADASAQADFNSVLNSSMKKSQTNLDSIFEAASEKYGIPVNLLKAVAKAESNFNANDTSGCGAMGIMQLMPETAKSLGFDDPYNPEQNIMGGAKYLSQMLDQFGGSTELALAAYNAGPGNVRKYDGIPPFEETQNYVAKVLKYCGSDLSATGSGTYTALQSGLSDASLEDVLSSSSLQDVAAYAVAKNLSPQLLMRIYQMKFFGNMDPDEEQNVTF